MLNFSANTDNMRLHEEPAPSPARSSRKRKSPPTNTDQPQLTHVIPPLMHLPPGYQYTDYTPGGQQQGPQSIADQPTQQSPQSSQQPIGPGGRVLSNSKRAEQNRKAQRAFRERRDQHVKALESRSQLLDAALASADEANRRWEECRALVDQLRVENAALRAALAQSQIMPPITSDQQKKEEEQKEQE